MTSSQSSPSSTAVASRGESSALVSSQGKTTIADTVRKERRMAECLVHERAPWASFVQVVTKTDATASEVRAMLSAAGQPTPVIVRAGWYF